MNNIDINVLIDISHRAGKAIMEIYSKDISVETKEDNSPLTLADKASNSVIVEALRSSFPSIPIISRIL